MKQQDSSRRGRVKRTFSGDDAQDFDVGVQRNRSNLGLHKRVGRTASSDSLDRMQTVEPPVQRRGNRRQGRLKKKSTPWYRNPIVRVFFGLAALAYLISMALFAHQAEVAVKDAEDTTLLLGPGAIDRHLADKKLNDERVEWGYKLQDMASGRKYRTTPDQNGIPSEHVQSYTHDTVEKLERDEHAKAIKGNQPPDVMRPAKMDELCGSLAKAKAKEFPNQYIHKDSLNEHARVIINGILNPIGFHLALRLEQECGAHVISGFDQAFPNTVTNRMGVQEEAGILSSTVTTLERPIFNSFLGLDPKVKNPAWPAIEVTGELDISKWQPTHVVHLSSFAPEIFRNRNAPWRNDQSPYVRDDYDPRLYSLRSKVVPMEQLMASLSLVGNKPRLPHLTYASSNQIHETYGDSPSDTWQARASLMDEVLADTYYQTHGTYSVGLRLPNAVYGPRGHPESDLRRIVERQLDGQTTNPNITWTSSKYDMVHIDDIVDGIIASMQFRNEGSKPVTMEFTSGSVLDRDEVIIAAETVHKGGEMPKMITRRRKAPKSAEAQKATETFIGWKPKVHHDAGLVRTVAWHMDRRQPYGPPLPHRRGRENHVNMTEVTKTGDELLKDFSIPTCSVNDTACFSSRIVLPCSSECSNHEHCPSSIFDGVVSLTQDVSQDCKIALYTQVLGDDVEDISLEAEFSDAEEPSICNFAFVSGNSKLVANVVGKVPAEELTRLGVVPTNDEKDHKHQTIEAKDRTKMNGRLLYRGWILIWIDETPSSISASDKFLLKLSPGKFFSESIQYAMYVDQSFPAMPTIEDVKFLAHQMHRPKWDQRTVKRKTRPKAKFRLPPEPERQAGLLVAGLKYQDAKDAEPHPSDTHVTLNLAVKFMRYEKGEDNAKDDPESEEIRIYREFLERIPTYVNRGDYMKSSAEPVFFYELHHWARTQWVMHDINLEPARQLRCDWYQETAQWGTPLDQLSLAHVMKKREMNRRITNKELDDIQMRYYDEKRDMLGLLSDAEEWHPLNTPQNKLCPTNYELEVMPYDKADTGAEESTQTLAPELKDYPPPLYARIISDRIMSLSRKAWNKQKKAEMEAEKAKTK